MKPSQVDLGPVMSMVFSNAGHVFTHMLTILYDTAVLYLPGEFDLAYGEMLGLSSVGLILFGVGSLPAGWFGDRWSQVGMLVIFFTVFNNLIFALNLIFFVFEGLKAPIAI